MRSGHFRSPGPRPAIAAALVLLALPGSGCGDRPESSAGVASSGRGAEAGERHSNGTPVLFIGLDGADWQLLDRLVADGTMPHLARLVAEGSSSVLATEEPTLSPLLWTTLLTGVSPLEHRILDFTGFSPAGVREPIRSDERRAPAVWNIASWNGRKTGVFGMWATFPAEPIHGVVVSDRFSSFLGPRGAPPSGAVHPPSWAPEVEAVRVRIERGVGLEDLRRFLPDLGAAEAGRAASAANPYADPVAGLRRMVVETRLQDELFREYVTRERPDLALLYLEATDTVGHLFAPYFPPQQDGVSAAEFARYRDVPRAFFAWIDSLLGGYVELARSRGAVLLLASDHGFRWTGSRPPRGSSVAHATAALWHRGEGIYVVHGPGIPAGPREREPQPLRRVAATILALAGLPPGTGMAGPPLPPVPLSPLAAEDHSARFRAELRERRPADSATAAPDAAELAKLRALGYLGGSEPATVAAGSERRSPGSFNNEGLLLVAAGRPDEARAAFERALALDPGFASAEWNLSELLWRSGEEERADALLLSALAHELGDGEARRAMRVATRLRRGGELLRAGDCAAAANDFDRAAALDAKNAAAPAAEGLAKLCLGDERGAAEAFRRSLALDPRQAEIAAALERLGSSPLH